jgi:hypothetical protein
MSVVRMNRVIKTSLVHQWYVSVGLTKLARLVQLMFVRITNVYQQYHHLYRQLLLENEYMK